MSARRNARMAARRRRAAFAAIGYAMGGALAWGAACLLGVAMGLGSLAS